MRKKTDDLVNEKLTRENAENVLRAAREELRNQAVSARDAEHLLNRLVQDANGMQQQQAKLMADKAKLESRVRELQGELQRRQSTPPPPLKPLRRPRAPSLTDPKVASMEQDLAQLRASASTTEMQLESTKERLSLTQNELVRAENEKAVMEKRLVEKDRKMRDILEEKSDLEQELEFHRGQNGAAEWEEELLVRLEDEENKVALLEQQLAKLSSTKDLDRTPAKLRDQLRDEISIREAVEIQEVDLVAAREEAFNDLEGARVSVEELTQAVRDKDNCIQELERRRR